MVLQHSPLTAAAGRAPGQPARRLRSETAYVQAIGVKTVKANTGARIVPDCLQVR